MAPVRLTSLQVPVLSGWIAGRVGVDSTGNRVDSSGLSHKPRTAQNRVFDAGGGMGLHSPPRKGGREAEGDGLLNRFTCFDA